LHEHLLLSVQKIRLDLGFDKNKRTISSAEAAESYAENQKGVWEAYAEAEQAFRELGACHDVDGETPCGGDPDSNINGARSPALLETETQPSWIDGTHLLL
jgi:hypothetical protein